MPHLAGNSLSALCALVPEAESIPRRILGPGELGRIRFLRACAGTKSNVIPEIAELAVEITVSAPEGWEAERILTHLQNELLREAQDEAGIYGVRAELLEQGETRRPVQPCGEEKDHRR